MTSIAAERWSARTILILCALATALGSLLMIPLVETIALWPLASAAESCFGSTQWPESVPAPTAWMEFDVEDVASASAELQQRGHQLLVNNRLEPWGQTVTRLLSPEGILIGITLTPWLRAPRRTSRLGRSA